MLDLEDDEVVAGNIPEEVESPEERVLTEVVEVRIQPSLPVIATSNVLDFRNGGTVSFSDPQGNKIGCRVAIFTRTQIVVSAEHTIDIFMSVARREKSDENIRKPLFFHKHMAECQVVTVLVFPCAVVHLKEESAAQLSSAALNDEVGKKGGQSKVRIRREPIEVYVEIGIEAMVNQASNLKKRSMQVPKPLLRVSVVVRHQQLLSVVHYDAGVQLRKLDGFALPQDVETPFPADVLDVVEKQFANFALDNGTLLHSSTFVKLGTKIAFSQSSFFGGLDVWEVFLPNVAEEHDAGEVVVRQVGVGLL